MSEGGSNVDKDEEVELVARISVPGDEEGDESESHMNIPDLQRDLEKADVEFANDTTPVTRDRQPRSVAVSTVSGFSSSAFSRSTFAARNTSRRRFRHATSIPGATRSDAYDDDLLHRAVQDAGRWAYGTIFVEVWLLTEDRIALVRPEGGWWIDPVHHQEYHSISPNEDGARKTKNLTRRTSSLSESLAAFGHQPDCPVCRLTDESRNDYIQPGVHVPGEGLPGVLWADDHHAHFLRDQSTHQSRRSFSLRGGGGPVGSIRGSFTDRGTRRTDGSARKSGYLFPKMKEIYQSSENDAKQETSPAMPTPRRGHSAPVADPHLTPHDREDLIAKSTMPVTGDTSRGRSHRHIQNNQHHHHRHHQTTVVWRNIKALVDDPDQPYNPRLHHMATKMGLGWAAAVPIRHDGEKQGICIYMARENVDLEKLRNPTNETYLVAATNLISAALILRTPRHEAVKERLTEFSHCMDRIRTRILEARALGIPLDELVRQNYEKRMREEQKEEEGEEDLEFDEFSSFCHFCSRVKHFLVHWIRVVVEKGKTITKKSLGANVKPPPASTWNQSFHTFCGVLIMGLILGRMNNRLQDNYGFNGTLIMGPFGALGTLLYGLTAAPASQPRNVILGQTLSITVALLISYIPLGSVWTLEVRGSVTAALAISLMTKAGVTHPPAGASAIIIAQNEAFGWSHLGVMLAGNVVAVLVAAVVNNFSDARQYPTYWGVGYVNGGYHQLGRKKKEF